MAVNKKWGWIVAIVVVAVIAFWGIRSTSVTRSEVSAQGETGTVNQGQAAPAFELANLQGETVSLKEFKGQKVYVKYWASWCPICLAGLEELNELSGGNHDYKVLTIVSPGYHGEKSAEDFTSWFSKRGYNNVEVLLDNDGTLAKKFGVKGYPTSYYIGSDGTLVKGSPGHQTNEVIEQTFQSIH
ncbi:TlpA family protein disulfide reductase [Paenibacillus pinihumi]|uniref:TlpA family protein disulfide reductase n=1 Tax=Paenibacillus pinihumi TaxID=669462 RepID=UPI0004029BBC|nr:redoxin domain-containing protein [Paenibacillus pinihumi]